MKYLLLIVICLSLQADAELKYNIHLASKHFSESKAEGGWNEKNYGFGIEKLYSRHYIGTGFFKNSFANDSFYVLAGTNYQDGFDSRVGVFVGAASGYSEEGERPVIIGIRRTYKKISILIAPYLLGLSLTL